MRHAEACGAVGVLLYPDRDDVSEDDAKVSEPLPGWVTRRSSLWRFGDPLTPGLPSKGFSPQYLPCAIARNYIEARNASSCDRKVEMRLPRLEIISIYTPLLAVTRKAYFEKSTGRQICILDLKSGYATLLMFGRPLDVWQHTNSIYAIY